MKTARPSRSGIFHIFDGLDPIQRLASLSGDKSLVRRSEKGNSSSLVSLLSGGGFSRYPAAGAKYKHFTT